MAEITTPTRAEIELAEAIVAEHQAAQRAWEGAVMHAVECGRLLIHAKETIAHGQWIPWLEENFPASVRTAQGYMRLARHGEDAQALAHLGVEGALRAMAEPRQIAAGSQDAASSGRTRAPKPATLTEIVRVVAEIGPQAALKPLDEDWWRHRQFGSDRAKLLEIGLIASLVDVSPIVVPVDSSSITWVWIGYVHEDELVYHPGWFDYSKKFVAGEEYRALIEQLDAIVTRDPEAGA